MATSIPVTAQPSGGNPLALTGAAGGEIQWTASAAAMSFINDNKSLLLIENRSGGSLTVTVEGVNAPDSGRDGTVVLTVPDDGLVPFGVIKSGNFTEAGLVNLTVPTPDADLRMAVLALTEG